MTDVAERIGVPRMACARKVMAVAALFGAASVVPSCASSGSSGPSTTASTAVSGNPKANSIAVENQPADGRKVKIAQVTLTQPGWVVVHADVHGAPGVAIGASRLLSRGRHENVTVTVDHVLKPGDKVMPMVNLDNGASATYSDVKANPPASVNGLVVVETITLT